MKNLNMQKLYALLFVLLLTGISAGQDCVYIEAESGTITGSNWNVEKLYPGYFGSGYVFYKGNVAMALPPKDFITYKFTAAKAGSYILVIRGRRDKGAGMCPIDAAGDRCNDVWIQVNGGGFNKKMVKAGVWSTWVWDPQWDGNPGPFAFKAGETNTLIMGAREFGVSVDGFSFHQTAGQVCSPAGTGVLPVKHSTVKPAFSVTRTTGGQLSFSFQSNAGKFTIYSAEGKTLKSFSVQDAGIQWSPKDAQGNRVKPGIYIGVFSLGEKNSSSSFVVF